MRSRYSHIRSKLVPEAHRTRAEATAYRAAASWGTRSWNGFIRMASRLGSSRNIFMNAEKFSGGPGSHCHCPGKRARARIEASRAESRSRDINSHETARLSRSRSRRDLDSRRGTQNTNLSTGKCLSLRFYPNRPIVIMALYFHACFPSWGRL
jgi:hypothetical protein